jgi:DNA-binding CsgD family transcriptional regulator
VATSHLTKREEEIRRLVVDGLTNDAIASELGISARTVEAHLRMLFRKTGASRRNDLSAQPVDLRVVQAAPDQQENAANLRDRLAVRDRQVRFWGMAIDGLIDRQFPLFDERVELTLTVGSRAGEDLVTERHWTTPNPYVIYRIIRPITPNHVTSEGLVESLSMTCEVVGADVGVTVDVVSDRQDRPLALILFQPGLSKTTEWQLRYRTPGLWNPLRDRGEDSLRWAAGTLDGRHADGLDGLVLKVDFPEGAEGASLVERRGVGAVEEGEGRTFVFTDESRTGGVYHWGLRMTPGA